ncbi:hypothetical protein ACFLSS_03260 [Bacteroidota bacterium]
MKKFSNTLMLILVVAALFYFYKEMTPVKINAVGLVKDYLNDRIEADKKYLTKNVELTGTVKAFYDLLEIGSVLELDNGEKAITLYCFFLNETDESAARQLSQSEDVTFIGNCSGLKKYKTGDVIRFDVKKIK